MTTFNSAQSFRRHPPVNCASPSSVPRAHPGRGHPPLHRASSSLVPSANLGCGHQPFYYASQPPFFLGGCYQKHSESAPQHPITSSPHQQLPSVLRTDAKTSIKVNANTNANTCITLIFHQWRHSLAHSPSVGIHQSTVPRRHRSLAHIPVAGIHWSTKHQCHRSPSQIPLTGIYQSTKNQYHWSQCTSWLQASTVLLRIKATIFWMAATKNIVNQRLSTPSPNQQLPSILRTDTKTSIKANANRYYYLPPLFEKFFSDVC